MLGDLLERPERPAAPGPAAAPGRRGAAAEAAGGRGDEPRNNGNANKTTKETVRFHWL